MKMMDLQLVRIKSMQTDELTKDVSPSCKGVGGAGVFGFSFRGGDGARRAAMDSPTRSSAPMFFR